MAKNADLTGAKSAKKDEFYTQLIDIENEVKHYRKHWLFVHDCGCSFAA